MAEIDTVSLPGWQASGDARERLIAAAAEIFADKGYAEASTREICKLANVNVASIHYYFGNKAALYQEVFRIPDRMLQTPPELADVNVPLRTAVRAWYRYLLGFVNAPAEANRLRLLFLREQMQPTGIVDSSRSDVLKPHHEQMTAFLCQRLGLHKPDLELHQLGTNLAGLAVVLIVERAAIQRLVPGMLDNAEQLNQTADRLAETACVLIEHERARRGADIARAAASEH